MSNRKISVVVPVYNEIENIKLFHQELSSMLQEQQLSYEIIYVDDHSTDGTWEWLSAIQSPISNFKFQISNGRTFEVPHKKNGILKQVQDDKGAVKVLRKVGKRGKAFSLKEGFDQASGSILVMIDGDRQYPVQQIPQMIEKLQTADVVVAERTYQSHQVIPSASSGLGKSSGHQVLRRIMSKGFRTIFGKMLFGLNVDVQSGLKVFTRKVYKTVQPNPSSAWTFDLEFLYKASQAGFTIDTVDITFVHREKGASKVNILKTPVEIGMNAVSLKTKRTRAFSIPPEQDWIPGLRPGMTDHGDSENSTMRGAGVGHKKKQYITHTTLPVSLSALETFSWSQKLIFWSIPLFLIGGLIALPMGTLKGIVTVLSVLYFIDTIFNLYVILQSLKRDNEIKISDEELKNINEDTLPMYTILCPLYKEAHVVPQFLEAIADLDWPKAKLDVMFLLEEDDVETIAAFERFTLPYYARTVVVPHSMPKTKPKACNYGLSFAKGEYLVIYDAEDIPDPLQLKKAYLGFRTLPENVQCLQAKLNFYNSDHNLLTRMFTADYSLWFDVMLPGLQSLNSSIPLGGTSNHFKTQTLRDLEGWDPFNVTEDADLGIRLFQKGYQTAVIDSTTMEEATSKSKIWFKQRSRWLKGYMQTYLVHMRNFGTFVKEKGLWHNIVFQLTVGGKILFILINPILWVLTLLYFTQYGLVGRILEQIYVPPVSYLAVFSWIFGNFLFFYYYMIGVGKRNQWDLAKYVFLIPVYWAMMSWAGLIGFYQLLFKPHYWEKTTHGFHLGSPKPEAKAARLEVQPAYIGNYGEAKPVYAPALDTFGPGNYEILNQVQNDKQGGVRVKPAWIFPSQRMGFAGGRAKSRLKTYDVGLKKNDRVLRPKFSILRRALPLLSMIGLDVVVAGFVLPTDKAAMYLIVSFFLKIVMVIMESTGALKILENNIGSILGLGNVKEGRVLRQAQAIGSEAQARRDGKGLKILIFNWRDIKHIYAGGAEVYVHELAKRWVQDGNTVTVFAGNDHKNPAYEKINGVEVYRRGGTYTVYFFAFLYYLLKFRGNYDVIIDCENGIPFFTPLFTRKPVILLIHHVHQEVFRVFLKFPLNAIAAFLEATLMPFIYKDKTIVTVSPSSRKEIFNLGFTQFGNIEIIPNGVSSSLSVHYPKTSYPSFVYIGRLKEYKNIDVALKAFAKVVKVHKDAKFSIVGWGEQYPELYYLVQKLKIGHAVTFYGKVTEKQKAKFLSESWVAVQPSLLEGWGITVIEANAAGTPVIASRVNGLQDSVVDGETGFLVEVGNVRQFAKAMNDVIGDSQLRERLSKNAQLWSMHFNWDKSADAFYRLIGKAITEDLQPAYGEAMAR